MTHKQMDLEALSRDLGAAGIPVTLPGDSLQGHCTIPAHSGRTTIPELASVGSTLRFQGSISTCFGQPRESAQWRCQQVSTDPYFAVRCLARYRRRSRSRCLPLDLQVFWARRTSFQVLISSWIPHPSGPSSQPCRDFERAVDAAKSSARSAGPARSFQIVPPFIGSTEDAINSWKTHHSETGAADTCGLSIDKRFDKRSF